MKTHWLDQAKKRLEDAPPEASDVPFERLRAQGMINDRGEVTGQLHRWNAFLAVTEVKRDADGRQIAVFRCLKPVFGMPGGATVDVSRNSMLEHLKAGKKVITAHRDDRLDLWKEGCDVHLSDNRFVVCGSTNDGEDNLGSLPVF